MPTVTRQGWILWDGEVSNRNDRQPHASATTRLAVKPIERTGKPCGARILASVACMEQGGAPTGERNGNYGWHAHEGGDASSEINKPFVTLCTKS